MLARCLLTFLTGMLMLPYGLRAQGKLNVDTDAFRNQVLSVIQLKMLDEYEAIVQKIEKDIPGKTEKAFNDRVNELERQLLNYSHFDQLLFEFNDLGITADDPQISASLRGIALDVKTFYETKGPITRAELQGYYDKYWHQTATLILDKESADILKGVGNLLSSAGERVRALQNIQLNSSELSEAELVKKLKEYGLSGDYLDKLKPIEQVLRSGWRDVPDPIGNYNLLHEAFSSESPSARIEALFSLGSKYGGQVPIIGQFIEPLFQLAEEVLKAAKGIGALLAANFNQGCIYTDGQYNVQEDPRAHHFLKQFPGVEVCPLYFPKPEGKSKKKWSPTSTAQIPAIYTQTYYNVLAENELYFYIGGTWKKAKNSPSHRGEDDIKAIVTWLRSNGMVEQALDAQTVFNLYNHSPGFIEFQKRSQTAVNQLFDAFHGPGGVFRVLKSGGCDLGELRTWVNGETGLQNLHILFPRNDQPEWDDYAIQYGRVWDELVGHLQHCEYNQYLKNKEYAYVAGGARPMVEVDEVLQRISFRLVEILGHVQGADGRAAAGIRARFDRTSAILPSSGYCQQEYADERGQFHFIYVQRQLGHEIRNVFATDGQGHAGEVDVEITPDRGVYMVNLVLGGDCGTDQTWNTDYGMCVPICGLNSHIEISGGQPVCACDEGFEWNDLHTSCEWIEPTEDENESLSSGEEEPDPEEEENVPPDDPEEPEDNLDPTLCETWPGAVPVVDPETGGVVCDCPSPLVWSLNGDRCISPEESLIERADCSAYPHTHAEWDATYNEVICACDDGYDFDENGTCIPTDPALIADADCSAYPNTRPTWSDVDQAVVCDCLPGFEWKADLTGCEKQNVSRDCADVYPGSVAVYDKKDGTWYCECPRGYEWNRAETACILTEQNALAQSSCHTIPNAQPKYNSRTQTTYCVCKPGYKWDATGTRCIRDPEFDQAMEDLIQVLTTLGNGETGDLGGTVGGGTGTDSPDNPVVTSENQHEGTCNTTYSGQGENVAEQYTIPINGSGSSFNLYYNMVTIKDRIHVYLNGYKIYDSGCVSGSANIDLQTGAFATGTLTVIVDPRCDSSDDTRWSFRIDCQ